MAKWLVMQQNTQSIPILQSGETFVRYQWGDTYTQFNYDVKAIQQSQKLIKFNIVNNDLAGDITQKIIATGK